VAALAEILRAEGTAAAGDELPPPT
jgi:hypothetical protein